MGIVGGGASGILTAIHLLRHPQPISLVVVEPRTHLGEGVAYSTRDADHLLNVRARRMTALPSDPHDFTRWAGVDPDDFVERTRYAEYLRDLLRTSLAEAPAGSTLEHRRSSVTNLGTDPTPWMLMDSGERVSVDTIVLAFGHDAPGVPDAFAGLPPSVMIADPWAEGALASIGDDDDVLVVGTGLTFADIAVTLSRSFSGIRIHAVSRHGLTPHSHMYDARPPVPAPDWQDAEVPLHHVLAYLRGFGDDWRRGVDSLRPITSRIWQALSTEHQEAFLRHLGRLWDVHRHRLAPKASENLARACASGQVSISAKTPTEAAVIDGRVRVGFHDGSSGNYDAVVLCTGSPTRLGRYNLGRTLLASGVVTPGPHGIGIDTDPDTGLVRTPEGLTYETLYALGPLRRGTLLESTSIPEIRIQAQDLAVAILGESPR